MFGFSVVVRCFMICHCKFLWLFILKLHQHLKHINETFGRPIPLAMKILEGMVFLSRIKEGTGFTRTTLRQTKWKTEKLDMYFWWCCPLFPGCCRMIPPIMYISICVYDSCPKKKHHVHDATTYDKQELHASKNCMTNSLQRCSLRNQTSSYCRCSTKNRRQTS